MDQPPVPSKSCPECSACMPETAAFCPNCGLSLAAAARATGKVGIFPENIAAAVAYFTFIPPIVFLLLEPYKANRFLRFHCLQSLLLCGATITLAAILRLAGLILFLIPVVGPLLVVLIDVLALLAVVLTWAVLLLKAFRGEAFRVPWLGDFADRYAAPR